MNRSEDHSVRCTGTIDIHVPDGFCSEYQTAEDAMQTRIGLEPEQPLLIRSMLYTG